MAHLVFVCPTTSMKFQHWRDENDDLREDEYEGIICPVTAFPLPKDRQAIRPG
jgi:hypothetical protein